MLDVHPSHGAISGWREFLVHILIIAIGLCLALALGQTVEFVHHRLQLADSRRALQQERAENRRIFERQTRAWRWGIAELQNNLLVLQYLQQHPGTPQEKLPGVLVWHVSELQFSTAAWDAGRESGVIALMPREEIEQHSALYQFLQREWDMAYEAALAVFAAERYDLIDADPSHLSAAQVAAEIDLVQTALGKVSLQGKLMQNVADQYTDFPATVTSAEMDSLHHSPDAQTRERLAPARALTMQRLRAAGYGER